MRRVPALGLVLAASLAAIAPRWAPEKKDSSRARVSLYRVAPGQQLSLLKWLSSRDEVAKEAGIPTSQVYAHLDGDAWDYMVIAPVTTAEQDRRFDEVARTRGLKTGFAAALEFRELLSWHTDTLVAGPEAAASLVAEATK
jgi:hypothetical protein